MKTMKHLTLIGACLCMAVGAAAQPVAVDTVRQDTFLFTPVKTVPITSVKNQHRSSTCWAFSACSFLESELLRMGKGEYDLSEMFVVSHTMMDRAVNYVRHHGDHSFAPGGSFYDVLYCMKHYGLVPQCVMPGINYGDTLPNHNELDAIANAYAGAVAKSSAKSLTPNWRMGLQAVYDSYLGACPTEFDYEGKHYTPLTFVEMLGLKADDYVSITSFSHHPFYETFAIEVQDNWRHAMSYNLPIDDMMRVIDHAINEGYTIAWGADVSEVGFTRQGIGVMPDANKGAELTGSDQARWTGLTQADKRKELTQGPLPEMDITQEMRQQAYDSWETTDDHGMQIYGIARDQNGKEYYMVKNSWGVNNTYKGTWYVSKAFAAYKTVNFIVNRNALPKDLRKRLGL